MVDRKNISRLSMNALCSGGISVSTTRVSTLSASRRVSKRSCNERWIGPYNRLMWHLPNCRERSKLLCDLRGCRGLAVCPQSEWQHSGLAAIKSGLAASQYFDSADDRSGGHNRNKRQAFASLSLTLVQTGLHADSEGFRFALRTRRTICTRLTLPQTNRRR